MANVLDKAEDTAPSLTDAAYSMKDPSGTPLDRHVFWKSVHNQWERSKGITIEAPGASEDMVILENKLAITIVAMRMILKGTTPSFTWTVVHGTDRSAAGTAVVTAGTTTTAVTSSDKVTTFNSASVAADSFIRLKSTAFIATLEEAHLEIFYKLT